MTQASTTEIREFLASVNALLIHFIAPTTNYGGGLDSLRYAQANPQRGFCFSTIQVGDKFQLGGSCNALGSVGLIAHLPDVAKVLSVYHDDAGSRYDEKNCQPVLDGWTNPTIMQVADSINKRCSKKYNEWFVQSYDPIGIFVFQDPHVFIRTNVNQGEVPIKVVDIAAKFHDLPIFSISVDGFTKFDRSSGRFEPVGYTEIIV